jgi:ArsR family transcriptional regulator
MSIYQQQSELFKALAHPVRLAILEILRGGEQCVCHMEAVLGLRQAYISQHLMVLREAGLVDDRRDGWNVFYRVVKPQVYAVMDEAGDLLGAASEELQLRVPATCPCPKCNPAPAVVIPAEQVSSN